MFYGTDNVYDRLSAMARMSKAQQGLREEFSEANTPASAVLAVRHLISSVCAGDWNASPEHIQECVDNLVDIERLLKQLQGAHTREEAVALVEANAGLLNVNHPCASSKRASRLVMRILDSLKATLSSESAGTIAPVVNSE